MATVFGCVGGGAEGPPRRAFAGAAGVRRSVRRVLRGGLVMGAVRMDAEGVMYGMGMGMGWDGRV